HERLVHVVDPYTGLRVRDQRRGIVDANTVELNEGRGPKPVQAAWGSDPDRALSVFQNRARLAIREPVRRAACLDPSSSFARQINAGETAEIRSQPQIPLAVDQEKRHTGDTKSLCPLVIQQRADVVPGVADPDGAVRSLRELVYSMVGNENRDKFVLTL